MMTQTLTTTKKTRATNGVPHRRRWRFVRRVAAAVLVLAVTLVLFRNHPIIRRAASRMFAVVYSIVDPSDTPNVPFGPRPGVARSELTSAALRSRLSRWFPEYTFHVTIKQPTMPDSERIEFGHESLVHQRVRSFRKSAQSLIANSPSVFDLSQNTRQLAPHRDDYLPETTTDPAAYLRLANDGYGFTCRYFAVLYGGACTVRGYTTRLIGLSRGGAAFDHAVCEVYVPKFGKWILVDPDFNVAYRRKGQWLNARELHDVWQHLKRDLGVAGHSPQQAAAKVMPHKSSLAERTGVQLVVLGSAAKRLRRTNLFGGSATGMNLEYFEFVFYSIRNDYLSASYPPGHPMRSKQYVLQAHQSADAPPVCPEAYPIDSIDDLYWSVGRTEIEILKSASTSPPTLQVRLATWTPNFKTFEYRNDTDIWTSVEGNLLSWKLHPGKNLLEARSVNFGGLRGEVSRIKISVVQPESSQPQL